jgi:hypothetical protein
MLGMVEIPAKAGASAPYSCLPAGREGGVKALPFLTGFTSEVQVESKGFFDVFHFSTAECPDMLNDPRSVYGSDLVGFDF